jgi:hypothetical protein
MPTSETARAARFAAYVDQLAGVPSAAKLPANAPARVAQALAIGGGSPAPPPGDGSIEQPPATAAGLPAPRPWARDAARAQRARSYDLRAATSLGNLWHQQGRPTDVHELVSVVYDSFTEGFDTPDPADTRALLAALSVSAGS